MSQIPLVDGVARSRSASLGSIKSFTSLHLFSRAGGPDQCPGGYFLSEIRRLSKSSTLYVVRYPDILRSRVAESESESPGVVVTRQDL